MNDKTILSVRHAVRRILLAASAGFLTVGADWLPAAELPVACIAGTCGSGPGAPRTWVTSGSATSTTSGNTLTINQASDRAILNWASFNVSADGHVVFNQPAKTSIALNRIYQDSPSRILGEVRANGEIYLVNPNGMIFGKTAVINAAGILASSLQISDAKFEAGLLSSKGTAALESDGRVGVLNADGTPKLGPDGQPIKLQLVVESGAKLSSTGAGGRVMLAGQNVVNGGTVEAADGQVVLAAGEKVYLLASKDSALRGLLVEVDAGGQAWNQLTGELRASHDNVTVVGLAVNQDGRISASTSVSANGSIRLLARDTTLFDNTGEGALDPHRGGRLELGKESSLEILPNLADSKTAVAEEEQLSSSIELNGQEIFMRGGARITAPSGQLNVSALSDPSEPHAAGPSDGHSRIRIESGVQIDLSGSHAQAPMSRNLVTVELRGDELRDSPNQRDGALRGKTVVVDARVGTPLANVSGAIAAIPRTIAERTTAGGSAIFRSEGDTVVENGAVINVSGGQTDYQAGPIHTSSVIAADGRIFDIGAADPSLTYVGVLQPVVNVKHDRWGIIEDIAAPGIGYIEPGYVSGSAAGKVQFAAPAMQLNGTLLGNIVSGPYQRQPGSSPSGGRLMIGDSAGGGTGAPFDYRAPSVTFTLDPTPVVVADTATLPENVPLQLSSDYLQNGGFTSTEIYSNGTVRLPEDMPLDLTPGSSLAVRANRIDILADIRNAGGVLSFTAGGTTPISGAATARAGVQIAAGTTLDVSGTWTNDSLLAPSERPTDLICRDGGTISIALDHSLVDAVQPSELIVGDEVQLLASGGGWVKNNGQVVGGRGGKLALLGGVKDSAFDIGNDVRLHGFGVAGAAGASLALNASRIDISSGTGSWIDPARIEFADVVGSALKLHSQLFSDFGFTTFDLLASGPNTADSMAIAAVRSGAEINMAPRTLLLSDADLQRASGGSVAGFGNVGLLDPSLRPATSFSLRAIPRDLGGVANVGSLVVESGAALSAGPRSQFNFASVGGIYIDGSVSARAGAIRLSIPLPDPSVDGGFDPTSAIELGSHAHLDVRGTTLLRPQAQPLLAGDVLAGGTVTLQADRGSILLQTGSVIDVSGAQAPLDFPTSNAATPYARRTIASAAGSLNLRAAESMWLAGAVYAAAGRGDTGPAPAGSLSVELFRGDTTTSGSQIPYPQNPRIVQLTAGMPDTAPGNGIAGVSTQWLAASEFDSLSIKSPNEIQIGDGAALHLARQLILDSPVLSMQSGTAMLAAPVVRLGSAQEPVASATGGSGRLDVNGDFLEILGSSIFQGIGTANLVSQGGLQLRGADRNGSFRGALHMAGELNLGASRIYPSTATEFLLESAGGDSSVIRILQQGASSGTPLSVAGHLTLKADEIVQGGTVLAPFGSIELDGARSVTMGAGSVTSVSAAGSLLPYGHIANGKEWVYGTSTEELSAIPSRGIDITGDAVTIDSAATLDISGGGDLYAYEWEPGTGGSSDALAAGNTSGLYAIMPALRDRYAPYDPQEFTGSGLNPGDSIYLSASASGLAAGTYVLLPARYALLPGAYLVSMVGNSTNVQSGTRGSLPDGTPVVAGQRTFGSTGLGDTQLSNFAVRPGSYGRKLAQYKDTLASIFYPARAQRLDLPRAARPADAGTLSLNIGTSLEALGAVRSQAADGGLGAEIDLSAAALAIVSQLDPASMAVQIRAEVLAGWNAGRLVIGGQSSGESNAIEVAADSISVGRGVTLAADQVVIVARDSVTLEDGATVASRSATAGADAAFHAPDEVSILSLTGTGAEGAALVAVSDLAQILPQRPDDNGGAGARIALNSGSQLRSLGSLTIDAPGGVTALGNLDASGAAVSLGSRRILLGSGLMEDTAFTLTPTLLGQLAGASSLRITGSDSIDFASAVSLGAAPGSAQPQFSSLELRSAQLRNLVGGNSVSLNAKEVILQGTTGVAGAANGTGELQVNATNMTLGPGTMLMSGFDRVAVNASGQISGKGAGRLAVQGDLDLTAARITSGAGADSLFEASGGALRAISAITSTTDLPALQLGGGLALHGRNVEFASVIALPSGFAELHADERLTIASGSLVDVSGATVTAAGRSQNSSAGTILLTAGTDLSTASGSVLAASAEQGANAGVVSIQAGGVASLGSELRGMAGASGRSGIFELDAAALENFSALNAALQSGGFAERRTVHLDSGDMSFAAATQTMARVLEFSTDSGAINVEGTLSAASTAVGRGLIRLYGGNGVTLGASGSLVADSNASSDRGGSIELGSSNGTVTLLSGSRIAAAGTAQSGELRIRAAAVGNDMAVGELGADLTRVGSVVLEPVSSFDVGSVLTDGDFASIRSNVDTYATPAAPAILARLGTGGAPNVTVQPGVELRSAGDLAIGGSPFDSIDLAAWRFAGQPAALSIRAAGSITVNGVLSDGFREVGFDSPPELELLAGASATMRLTAGANLLSADPLGLARGSTGSLNLAPGARIRAGAGSIQLAAADNIVFGAADPDLGFAAASVLTAGFAAAPTQAVGDFQASFFKNGGDVRLYAGNDIIGAPITQSPGAWMPRQGTRDDAVAPRPTLWGIDVSRFGWNIGALGGGDVDIRAGRDVNGLSVAVADSAIEQASNTLDRFGGGGLDIRAGRDVGSGMYYIAHGDGFVRAGRSLSASTITPEGIALGALFMLGDARVTVDARRDVAVESVLSPNALEQPDVFQFKSYFFGYGEDSGLTARSNGGSIDIGTTEDRLSSLLSFDVSLSSRFALTVLPPSLQLSALRGDLVITNVLTLFPAARSQLDLFATRDVSGGLNGDGILQMSDAALSAMATPLQPLLSSSGFDLDIPRAAASARHLEDPLAAQVTAGRDVVGLTLQLPKSAAVRAARDIIDTSLTAQNLHTNDVTAMIAGRDVAYGPRTVQGFINVGGPGRLDVVAGRNVDFGFSQGITTLGALTNPAIPSSQGAAVNVLAGLNRPLDSERFVETIISSSADYQALLVSYVENGLGSSDLTFQQARAQFAAASDDWQRPLLLEIFFRELVKSGREANADPQSEFARGYAAIDALLPGSRSSNDDSPNPYVGDINLGYSRIYTLAGGNISLLAPGGLLNVGLATAPQNSTLHREPAELGIVAQRSGDIRVFANNDVLVNASRLFTLLGGDIAVWSTLGNIDAGRGAKSAISAPPPRVTVDDLGHVKIDVRGAVSGSGIRTIITDPDVKPGDVDLIAPAGFVNAGDAGIGAAGNLNVAARQVVGLDNIQVGGTSTGVPPDTSGLGAALAAASAVGSGASSAAASAIDSGNANQGSAPLASSALSWLDVFIEGFGEEACKANDQECLNRNRKL